MNIRRRAKLPHHLLAALALSAAVSVTADDAKACGGGWWPEIQIDYRVQGIARAERDLKKGRYDAAAGSVIRMIPHIRHYRGTSSDSIVNRALRVLALATARKDGALDIGREVPREILGGWLGEEKADRGANLEWSVATLKAASAKKKDKDPIANSELAEAMAHTDAHRAEGRQRLEKLAEADLLVSAESYRMLAELRAEAGDPGGRLAALDRCRKMTKNAEICVAPAIAGRS